MINKKYKRNIYNVLINGIPGAKEYLLLILAMILFFFISLISTAYIFVKIIQIGRYGDLIIGKQAHIFILCWTFLFSFFVACSIYIVLNISRKIAGPIKRIESLLDEALLGKAVSIKVREDDALKNIVDKINRLIEMFQQSKLRNN